MLALDTDILAIYHIFHNDARFKATKTLFDKLEGKPKALAIFNLLELCGILASAERGEDSKTLFLNYMHAQDISILFPKFFSVDEKDYWSTLVSECFSRIQKGLRLGDAVILWTLETNSNVSSIVTWNTRHFKGKTLLKVLTPPEALEEATAPSI